MFMSTRYKKKDPAWRGRPLFSVDDSLAKLFECLTIEYCCSKLISPKWKNFRNQKLKFEHKTRLNNAIWRAWHIQYKLNSKARFCQFEAPFSDQNVHSTPQAVILEGRYWKKRLDTVSYEYLKWRKLYSNKGEEVEEDINKGSSLIKKLIEQSSPKPASPQKKVRSGDVIVNQEPTEPFCLPNIISDEDMVIDSFAAVSHLPDTLFSSLEHQRHAATAASGVSYATFTDISDTIQPTLDQLNPCFDELMENFDFLTSSMWNDSQSSQLYTLAEEQQARESLDMMTVDEINTSAGSDVRFNPIDANTFENSFQKDVGYSLQNSDVTSYRFDCEKQQRQFEACSGRVRCNDMQLQSSCLPTNATTIPDCSIQTHAAVLQEGTAAVTEPSVAAIPDTNVSANASQASALLMLSGHHLGRTDSELPPKLQAPNLAARLQAGTKHKSKPVDVDAVISGSTSCKDQPTGGHKQAPGRQASSSRSKRGNLPRNRSDSSLLQVESQARSRDTGGTAKDRRRGSGKNADNRDPRTIQRNYSDPSLSSMITSPRKTPHILPKGIVTAIPMSQSMLVHGSMPFCPPGLYPGQGPTLLVRPQPPGNNEPGQARLYMPRSTAPSATKQTITVSSPVPGQCVTTALPSATAPASQAGNVLSSLSQPVSLNKAASNNQVQPTAPAQFPLFTDTQLTSLMQLLEKKKDPQGGKDTANQVAYLEQLQQQLNTVIRQQHLSSEQRAPAVTGEKEPQPMEGVTPLFNAPVSPANRHGMTSPTTSQGIVQQSFNGNSVTYILPVQSQVETMQVDEPVTVNPQIVSARLQTQSSSPQPTLVSLGEGVYVQLDGGSPSNASDVRLVGIPNAFCGSITPLTSTNRTVPSGGYDTVMVSSPQPMASSACGRTPERAHQNDTFTPPRSLAVSPSSAALSSDGGGRIDASSQQGAASSNSLAKMLTGDPAGDGVGRKENRRRSHITAEQRRRGSIKAALDEFLEIIPALKHHPSNKISKAMTLQKATAHIVHLQSERNSMTSKLDVLRAEVKELNNAIQTCQQRLPASGASMNHKKEDLMMDSFIKYVKSKIRENHSFWIFSIMLRPLFDSFCSTVSTVTVQEFLSSVFKWLDESCSLPVLRPVMSTSLRRFTSCTSILTDPSQVSAQALLALDVDDPTTLDKDPSSVVNDNEAGRDWENTCTSTSVVSPAWSFEPARTKRPKKTKQSS